MAIGFFLTFFAAVGLGLGPIAKIGTRTLSGLSVLLMALFLGGLLPGIPFSWIVRALFVVAIGRLFFVHHDFRRTSIWAVIAHPVIILPAVYFGFWIIFVHRSLALHQWDEFSHWALMPKQILLYDRMSTPEFPFVRFLEYTPGWPSLLIFPRLLTGSSYSDSALFFGPLLIGVAVTGLIYDLSRDLGLGALSSWILVLLLARLRAGITLYPDNLLIESALEGWAAVAFAAAAFSVLNSKSSRPLLLGLATAAGYLIKKSFVFMLPLAIWRTVCGKSWKSGVEYLLPVAVVLLLWKLWTRNLAHPLFVVRVMKPDLAMGSQILGGMGKVLLSLGAEYGALTCLALISFVLLVRKRDWRGYLCVTGVAGIAYFFGLWWLYLTSFPGNEGQALASCDRYLLSGMKMMAAGLLIPAVWVTPMPLKQIILAGLVVANAEQLQHSFHLINRFGIPSPILAQAEKLDQTLINAHDPGASVVLIDEGEGRIVEYQALFASIIRRGPPAFAVAYVTDRYEQGLHKTDYLKLLQNARWIWPVRMGRETETELRSLIGPASGCTGALTSYFLHHDGRAWVCIPIL